jgi:Pyruvate/2-oxoacid:ferredoxin oxidoreductase gamma subunit
LNVVMIGALKGLGSLPVSEESLKQAIVELVPTGTHDMNLEAFKLGIEATNARAESAKS